MSVEKYNDPILLVLSSDHVINDVKKFINVVEIGSKFAEINKLVTFGVIPTSPETGYGYIKAAEPFGDKIEGFEIESFIEKPDKKMAQKLLKDNRFTWNSGMFMFKSKEIIKEVNEFYPEILKSCKNSINKSEFDLDFQRLDKSSFKKISYYIIQ